jgi:acetyl-CoA carboxylase biotin carboxyl carrier protein
MDFKKVQDLIKYFEASKLTVMSIEDGEFKISLSKLNESSPVSNNLSQNGQNQEGKFLPPNVNPQQVTNPSNKPTVDVLLKDVTSPLVGTYYAASSPTSEPFMKVGQRVNKGQTVCIIEAMKIMNEISSPYTGVVEKLNFKNGDVVGYSQVIAQIRPQE